MGTEVVVFRPLWSLFINKTERWLSFKASNGYRLKQAQFEKSRFLFERGQPEKLRFCFCYHKFPAEESFCERRKLESSGWVKTCASGKWCLYASNQFDSLSIMPNRKGLYLRNNSILCAYSTVSFLILLTMLALSLARLLLWPGSYQNAGQSMENVLLLSGLFSGLVLFNFLLFLHFSLLNNTVLEDLGSSMNPEYSIYRHSIRNKTFEGWLEKLFIQDGDIVRKFWPLWILSPDHLEQRLEKMERNGFNFYKAGKRGLSFYFVKGNPQNIRYCVVGEKTSSLDATLGYLTRGWKVVYSTSGQPDRVFILSKPFDDEKPALFADCRDYMENTKRLAHRPAILLLALLFLDGFLMAFLFILGLHFIYPQAALMLICALLLFKIFFYVARSKSVSEKQYWHR